MRRNVSSDAPKRRAVMKISAQDISRPQAESCAGTSGPEIKQLTVSAGVVILLVILLPARGAEGEGQANPVAGRLRSVRADTKNCSLSIMVHCPGGWMMTNQVAADDDFPGSKSQSLQVTNVAWPVPNSPSVGNRTSSAADPADPPTGRPTWPRRNCTGLSAAKSFGGR